MPDETQNTETQPETAPETGTGTPVDAVKESEATPASGESSEAPQEPKTEEAA